MGKEALAQPKTHLFKLCFRSGASVARFVFRPMFGWLEMATLADDSFRVVCVATFFLLLSKRELVKLGHILKGWLFRLHLSHFGTGSLGRGFLKILIASAIEEIYSLMTFEPRYQWAVGR